MGARQKAIVHTGSYPELSPRMTSSFVAGFTASIACAHILLASSVQIYLRHGSSESSGSALGQTTCSCIFLENCYGGKHPPKPFWRDSFRTSLKMLYQAQTSHQSRTQWHSLKVIGELMRIKTRCDSLLNRYSNVTLNIEWRKMVSKINENNCPWKFGWRREKKKRQSLYPIFFGPKWIWTKT